MVRSKYRRFRHHAPGDVVFDVILYVFIALFLVFILYPLLYILAASFTEPEDVYAGHISLFIKNFSITAYKRVFANETIWHGYLNTIYYSLLMVIAVIGFNFPASYAMSRKELRGRTFFIIFFCIPLYFGGGIVPLYVLVRGIGLYNNVLALILPYAFSFSNVVLIRTYMTTAIPEDVQEAAKIDGAGYTRIFFQIVLPLSGPILSIIALFALVGMWNSYYSALVFLSDESKNPLQLVLRSILLEQDVSDMTGSDTSTTYEQAILAEALKYSSIVVSTLPILVIYPFFSRFFEKGIMVGSLKG